MFSKVCLLAVLLAVMLSMACATFYGGMRYFQRPIVRYGGGMFYDDGEFSLFLLLYIYFQAGRQCFQNGLHAFLNKHKFKAYAESKGLNQHVNFPSRKPAYIILTLLNPTFI